MKPLKEVSFIEAFMRVVVGVIGGSAIVLGSAFGIAAALLHWPIPAAVVLLVVACAGLTVLMRA